MTSLFATLRRPELAIEALNDYLGRCPDAARIRFTIEQIAQGSDEQPRGRGWLARLLGR